MMGFVDAIVRLNRSIVAREASAAAAGGGGRGTKSLRRRKTF